MRVPLWLCLVLAPTLSGASLAAARPFEVPTFALAPPAEVSGTRVAVGTDGTMLFAWQTGSTVQVQRYAQAGVALAAPVTVASGVQPRLAADTRGGYVLAYSREEGGHRHLFGWRLDGAGQPVGAEIAVDGLPDDDVGLREVLGVPSGFAFVWQQGSNCWLRRFAPDGAALAGPLLVGDNGRAPDEAGFPLAAAALDDGGITVVWHDPSVHTLLARSFDGDGSPRAGPRVLQSFDVQAIAPTASGGFVATGILLSSILRVVEYDASFTLVAARDVEVLAAGDTPLSMLARDAAGRWLLVYATAHYDIDFTQLLGHLPPRARPLAADLTPLEPSFALDGAPASQVATALLPTGSFVNAWATAGAPGTARGYADVVSLCTPDVHLCGDGVLDPRCEECDDGAANDDLVADACRTSCALPSCGDGVADAGEVCDDGTASPCDGCDAACHPVAGLACGDGVVVAGCGDQCDDGNAVVGDGCAPMCTLERVPGGGSRSTDCLAEWLVVNPSNVPLLDGRGRMRRVQRCVDDDPACDFDGGTPGSCTFRVSVCTNNGDLPGCTAAPLADWDLAKPSLAQAAHHPALAAARVAFAGIPAAVIGVADADACAAAVDVVVPLRGADLDFHVGKTTLGAIATAPGGARDQDGLTLICLPR